MIGYGTQFMATITWSKKSPSQSIYIGQKVHIVATWNTIKQKILMTPSAQIGRHSSLSTTSPSKGVIRFVCLIVSHVATICTFGSI